MQQLELQPNSKAEASRILRQVIVDTRNFFPDPNYRPFYLTGEEWGINPHPHFIKPPNADGIGTKPELAERMYADSQAMGIANPNYFYSLAYDLVAMVEGDLTRKGIFTLGVTEIIDVNSVDNETITALADGLTAAAKTGRFAIFDGETAELGQRTGGYGDFRLNWNASALGLIVAEKVFDPRNLRPGQTIVAFAETSIRSNGLTKARQILEAAHLQQKGYISKETWLYNFLMQKGCIDRLNSKPFADFLKELYGPTAVEDVLVPWHEDYHDLVLDLLMPSTLYGPIIYDAQGGVDGEVEVGMIAAAHITGGGVPEKVGRMLRPVGLGAVIDTVFPDPPGVEQLLSLSDTLYPIQTQEIWGNGNIDKAACETWNRGIGFVIVTETEADAHRLIEIAEQHECNAAIVGEIIKKPEIHFRGHRWPTDPNL